MEAHHVEDLFTFEARIRRWLRFEAQLAVSESAHGVIPSEAALAIDRAARDTGWLDLADLKTATRTAAHPVVPFVRALAGAAGEAGEYVHWGATSQDVVDTGRMLGLLAMADALESRVVDLLRVLRSVALEHEDTLMVGRTLGQHATPITFGGKVAGLADPLVRWLRIFRRDRPELLVGQFGGATGQFAVLGPVGYQVRESLLRALGLGVPVASWHTGRDRFRRVAGHCAALASEVGRIAAEIVELQRTEVGEAAESFGRGQVGSSAMPHKRNPTRSSALAAEAAIAQSELAALHGAWRGAGERDKSQFHVEAEVLPRLCDRTFRMTAEAVELVGGLVVDGDRMQKNLEAHGNQCWSEFILYRLAASQGRSSAHELLHEAQRDWGPDDDLFVLAGYGPSSSEVLLTEMREQVRVAGRELVHRAVNMIDEELTEPCKC